MEPTIVRDPMYQQINKRLRLLVGREYTFGQQFPTEREIVQRFAVSRATASKLADISSVKIVSFSAVNLDDGALVALKALPNLAVVEIWNSCDWSDADLEALKAAKPKVRFHMVGGSKK